MICRKLASLIGCMAFICSVNAQNFNYTFSQSSSIYTPLIDSMAVELPDFWNATPTIPLGFEMNVAGSPFREVSLNPNGTLAFDSLLKISFVSFFKNFYSQSDENQMLSKVFYQYDSLGGNNTIKIEFRNFVFSDAGLSPVTLSFQIWLSEEGNKIELNMGPVEGMSNDEPCHIGFLNSYDTVNHPLGYLLSGSPSAALAVSIPANGAPVQLSAFPAENTLYSFSLQNN